MGWFRKKQKEVAEIFVEDTKEILQTKMKDVSLNRYSAILKLLPLVVGIAEIVISTDTGSAQGDSTSSKAIVNYGTINIYNK